MPTNTAIPHLAESSIRRANVSWAGLSAGVDTHDRLPGTRPSSPKYKWWRRCGCERLPDPDREPRQTERESCVGAALLPDWSSWTSCVWPVHLGSNAPHRDPRASQPQI